MQVYSRSGDGRPFVATDDAAQAAYDTRVVENGPMPAIP